MRKRNNTRAIWRNLAKSPDRFSLIRGYSENFDNSSNGSITALVASIKSYLNINEICVIGRNHAKARYIVLLRAYLIALRRYVRERDDTQPLPHTWQGALKSSPRLFHVPVIRSTSHKRHDACVRRIITCNDYAVCLEHMPELLFCKI